MSAQRKNSKENNERNERLFRFLRTHCYRVGEPIALSAGGTSSVYFDCKRATGNGDFLRDYADWILRDIAPRCCPNHVGGPMLGAVGLAAAVCMAGAEGDDDIVTASIVRKEVKEHGTARRIENEPAEPARVLVLEDVITTGASVAGACDAYLAAGHTIAGIAVIIDREAGGAQSLAEKYNVEVFAMFRASDFSE